ncbi:MAG TPA: glycerol-3-phosphate acyltransferase [Ktedonobacterales bacterium]|nr:glycerol-3-phosphate acyltransferase [Ktedonobacterales bacterium]
MNLALLGLLPFAYLLGSLPFSALIARWRTGEDLSEVGEGNVGARNVWHVVGPVWGVLASLLDGLKGWLCYLVSAFVFHAPLLIVLLAGVAVTLGHQFPVFRRGRGGKGLSTIGGFLLGLAPWPTVIGAALMAALVLITGSFNENIFNGLVVFLVLPLLFHEPIASLAALGFATLAALKNLLDRPHGRRVWARNPWRGTTATPSFLRRKPEPESAPAAAAEEAPQQPDNVLH